MIKTILVPLDGSSVAEQGLAAACRIARGTGAALLLMRSVVYFAVEEATREDEGRDLQEAREYLDTVKRDLERQGLAVATEVLPVDPVRAILFAAEAHDVDLISICTHGRSGIEHAVLGSVAGAVLRRSTAPILLTRAGAHATSPTGTPYGRILVPLDGTAFAETALSYLRREEIGRGAKLLLLRVVAPVPPPLVPAAMRDGALAVLDLTERAAKRHRLEGEASLQAAGAALPEDWTWQSRVMLGDPGEVILRVAEGEGSELIAIATHGHHGWDRLLHGSVTRRLLHRSTIPMLIMRGVAADAAEEGVDAAAAQAGPIATGAGQIAPSA